MKLNGANNYNILPFYSSKEYWHSKRWYTYGQICPVAARKDYLVPFQLYFTRDVVSTSGNITLEIKRVNDDVTVKSFNLNHSFVHTQEYVIIKFPEPQIAALPLGLYYYKVTYQETDDSGSAQGEALEAYSDILSVIDDESKFVRLEYWNASDITTNSYVISFTDSASGANDFKFVSYIRSTIAKPDYEFEEELTKRLGYKFIETQVSTKVYKFNYLATEANCDAMRIARMCDYIKFTTPLDVYNALYMSFEVAWQDYGDVANLTVEFETDTIIQRLESFKRSDVANFYNALLYNINEPILFDYDTIAQYYSDFSGQGKMIRELDQITADDITPASTMPIDLGQGAAKKIAIEELDNRYVNKAGDTMTGNLVFAHTSERPSYSGSIGITFREQIANGQGVKLVYNDYDIYRAPAGLILVGEQGGEYFEAPAIYQNGYKVWDAGNKRGMFSSMNEAFTTWGNEQVISVEGDANTYYPVVIKINDSKTWNSRIAIYKNLGSRTPSYPGNHSGGTSSMWAMYEGRYSGWDGNSGYIITKYVRQPYANLISKAEHAGYSVGALVMYLRGGGCEYTVCTDYRRGINVYYERTEIGGYIDHPVYVEPTTSVGNRGVLNTTSYDYLVQKAVRLETPRTIFGKSFDGKNNVTGGAKFANICIETDNNRNDRGRVNEINNYTKGLYLQCNSPYSLICCTGGGNVGIGTTSPSYKLHVDGDTYCHGNFYATGEVAAGSASDLRLKEIQKRPSYANRLLKMGLVRDYYFNDLAKSRDVRKVDNDLHTGMIYQDVLPVLSSMCGVDDDGYGKLNYIKPDFICTIAGATQDNTIELIRVNTRMSKLETAIRHLKRKINKLERRLSYEQTTIQ